MPDFIQTLFLTVAHLFSFLSSSCSCWKYLSGQTPSLGQTSKLLHNFSVNTKWSYYIVTQLFLFTSNSTVLIAANSTVLVAANSTGLITANSTVLIAASSTVLITTNSTVIIMANSTVLITLNSSCSYILYQESTLLCRLWSLHCSATLKYILISDYACLTF